MGNTTAANAIAGKPSVLGGIFWAPIGTALPTDESTVLADTYKSVGYLTDSGTVRATKIDTETKKAWGGDPLIIIDKGKTRTAKFGFAEYLNEIVQKLINGEENVTVTPATATKGRKIKIVDKDVPAPHGIWVIQLFSGTAVGRVIFPDAQITEREDVTYKDEDIAANGVTVTQFPDENGQYALEYWDDGRKVITP